MPIKLKCKHTICEDCFTEWERSKCRNNKLCPICRRKTHKDELKHIAKEEQFYLRLKKNFLVISKKLKSIHDIQLKQEWTKEAFSKICVKIFNRPSFLLHSPLTYKLINEKLQLSNENTIFNNIQHFNQLIEAFNEKFGGRCDEIPRRMELISSKKTY
jgi:hypothetical protein